MPCLAKSAPAAGTRLDATGNAPATRLEGLDALRAGTMLLVVAFHAALAYAPTPIPRLIWACRDPGARPIFDLFCWWSLGISAPFFLMSGFFAAELHAARGARAFLVGRSRRIGVPLLAATATVLPATFLVWVAGWLSTGQCTPREVLRLRFHGKGFQENLLGPGHLWSLEYLALMLAMFWAWDEVARRLRGPGAGRRETRPPSPWRPVLAAIPSTVILWAGHRHGGLDVILDRSNSFLPEPYRFLHYGLFFAEGAALSRGRRHLAAYAPLGWAYLALSVVAFAARAWLIRGELAGPLAGPPALALAATGALSSWLLTFGLLGVALGPAFARPRASVRYLADGSYWIYLVHLPLVGLAQVALLRVQAPAGVKFAAVLGATMALGLGSYRALVRHTALGAWLHGRRDRVAGATAGPGGGELGAFDRARRRPAFRLMALACAVPAGIALLLAGRAHPLPGYAARQAAEARVLEQVRRLGGSFERDPGVQDDPVVAVVLAGRPVDATAIGALEGLPLLQRLGLRGAGLSEADLYLLAGNEELRVLDLDETQTGDTGLAFLTALPKLRGLYLARTAVTDEGLTHVGRLGKLLHLGLSGTAVTDAGLARLRTLIELRVLDLGNTRVTDAGIASLREALPRTRIIATPRAESAARRPPGTGEEAPAPSPASGSPRRGGELPLP